jgi:hypothetical protein
LMVSGERGMVNMTCGEKKVSKRVKVH